MGDLLLLRPLVAALRRAGHAVTLLAPAAPARVLVGPGPGEACAVLDWERGDFASLLGEGTLARSLRDVLRSFDVALVLSRSLVLAEGLAAIVSRVIRHDPDPPPGAGHASAWLARPLLELGLALPDAASVLVPTAAEAADAAGLVARLPRAFLTVHPGSGSPGKNWPAERYAGLVEALAAGRAWLLVRGPADERATAPLRSLRGAVVAHELPLRVLGAALSRAGLYVGNDSGVSHLAAAFGAPTLALFGPTDPARWGPLGPRVVTLRAPAGRLESLRLREVLAAVPRLRPAAGARPSG